MREGAAAIAAARAADRGGRESASEALRPTKEFTGRLVTKDPVKVIPQVTGRLLSREFKDGDYVEEGKTVLFRIDPVLYQADVEKAKADIAQGRGRHRQLDGTDRAGQGRTRRG